MNLEKEIAAALEKLTDAYSKRDLKAFLECFSSEDNVIVYGTGADEKRMGIKQIQTQVERDWEQSETAEMLFDWTLISGSESVAWVAADGKFKIKAKNQGISIPVRITFVFEKKGERWLIVQAHFSVAALEQEQGESF